MKDRLIVIALVILAILACFALWLKYGAGVANGAPLSPSAQFAYNVAERETEGTGACETVDAQIVPEFPIPQIVAQFSATDCYVYLSRELAGSRTFAKTCKVLVTIFRTFGGLPLELRMPPTCFSHQLFLMNHPYYLQRRFR